MATGKVKEYLVKCLFDKKKGTRLIKI